MKPIKVLAVAMSAVVMVAFAQDAEIVKVNGRGVGTDKTEALKDAYRDAVERAVGLYVDAEQMMKNEKLVKDQILTQSNAYIEKYEVAKETTKPNGLVEIQILAEVRKTALTKKIADVMPSKTFKLNSSTTQNLHAQIVTDEKRSVDGAALMKNALEGIDPVRQLVKASLVSPEPEIVNKRGSGSRKDDDFITLRYTFKFEIDRERYLNEFLPHLQKTLEQISTTPPKTIRMTGRHSEYCGKEKTVFYGLSEGKKISTGSRGGGDSVGGCKSVLLLTECDAGFNIAKARLYGLSDSAGSVLSSWQYGLAWGKNGCRYASYNVIVRSKEGAEICVVPLMIGCRDLSPIAPAAAAGQSFMEIIAPLVGMQSMSRLESVTCKIPKDDLPSVDSITIEFAD